MTSLTKIRFFCIVWAFSAICAILGTLFISTAAILQKTPYDIAQNPIVGEIRQDMGPYQNLAYFDLETGMSFWNVRIQVEGESIQLHDEFNVKIGPLNALALEEIHTNGSIFYIQDLNVLVYDFYNGTFYEVKAQPEELKIDISNINKPKITLEYQPGAEYPIQLRNIDIFDTTAPPEEEEKPSEVIGNYFIVENRGWISWFQAIIQQFYNHSWDAFLMLGRLLLITVAIGGGAGIITALFLIFTRLTRLFGGKRFSYTILKALNGKLGKIISFIPLFDFEGDFFVDERLVNVVDLSKVRSTFSELYRQRWYDILVFPTSLASILTIIFVQNYPGEDKMVALALSPLLTPIVLILSLLYFPAIWAFNEGGFKRMQISPQGDIIAVKPLGKILRDGLGIVIGISGILSLGALAMEVTVSVARQSTTTGQLQVAGFSLDIFSLLLLVLWTLGLFFVLLGSGIVGVSILAVNYLQSSHLDTIEYLRSKSEKDGVVSNWGSVTYQFSPVATKAVFEKT
jgi:hypothetical protein